MPARRRRRQSLRHAPSDGVVAEVALAIVAELERCASVALRCRAVTLARPDTPGAHATALADENRRLRKRLRELTADKAVLQHILKRAR